MLAEIKTLLIEKAALQTSAVTLQYSAADQEWRTFELYFHLSFLGAVPSSPWWCCLEPRLQFQTRNYGPGWHHRRKWVWQWYLQLQISFMQYHGNRLSSQFCGLNCSLNLPLCNVKKFDILSSALWVEDCMSHIAAERQADRRPEGVWPFDELYEWVSFQALPAGLLGLSTAKLKRPGEELSSTKTCKCM